MAVTAEVLRVFELRIINEEKRLKEEARTSSSKYVQDIIKGRIEGLNSALAMFREEFGKNGRTSRAL